ncbi:MAG: hypothetical protein JSU65_04545, partial [Candidatus Zixiibacteriota bacterium]
DTALATHIDLDYRLPPSDDGRGGDTARDVYFEEMPYYGYAVPEGQGPEPWNDYFSYLVLHRDYTGFPPNNDPEGDIAGAAKATAAHEFHHCVQFAYDAGEPPWFQELDATYMEDIVYDLTDDNYNYLPGFMNFPEKSLMESSLHMYGSFLWGVFLAERFDTSLMVSVWEGARFDDVYSALSDTLLANYGWTQDSAFAEFTVWNYITGQRDDGNHYQEGSSYPAVAISETYASYPRLNILSPEQPAGYGSCYIQFRPGTSVGNLRLTFTGSLSRTWAAYVIKSSAVNVHQPEKMVIDDLTQAGSLDVQDFENYESVTLIGINLDEFSGGASFNCGAEIVGDHAVSSVLLTDSMVYAGVARDFEYEMINISPVNDVYRATAWDDSGWIAPIMVDRFIAAGESSIVDIPVSPPAGTPLGSSSVLFFRATSLNDTDVWHEVNGTAYTVLQRGDADFDGLVDIGDLT